MSRVIPFSKPYFDNQELEDITRQIKKVLKSGWLTAGPIVSKFEEEFSRLIGSNFTVAFNSCTAALHSILLALNINKGDFKGQSPLSN